LLPVNEASAQFGLPSEIHISGNNILDREITAMMNELDLKTEQQIVIGILLLKYGAEFDIDAFESASKLKQVTMAQSTLNKIEKDFKVILDKGQFKVYKKHRKVIKKELKKSART
jgi:hypothetical protein